MSQTLVSSILTDLTEFLASEDDEQNIDLKTRITEVLEKHINPVFATLTHGDSNGAKPVEAAAAAAAAADPNVTPKKSGGNGYTLFQREEKDRLGDAYKAPEGMTHQKWASDKWNALSKEEQKEYNDRARKMRGDVHVAKKGSDNRKNSLWARFSAAQSAYLKAKGEKNPADARSAKYQELLAKGKDVVEEYIVSISRNVSVSC